ncbi:hypothetical protein D3C71_1703850 [compost metagenome]
MISLIDQQRRVIIRALKLLTVLIIPITKKSGIANHVFSERRKIKAHQIDMGMGILNRAFTCKQKTESLRIPATADNRLIQRTIPECRGLIQYKLSILQGMQLLHKLADIERSPYMLTSFPYNFVYINQIRCKT